MKNYLVAFNATAIINDLNGVFHLNDCYYYYSAHHINPVTGLNYPRVNYIIPLSNEEVFLIKLGQYKKYILEIEPWPGYRNNNI